VLEELAGLSKADIARLEETQVIYCDRKAAKPSTGLTG